MHKRPANALLIAVSLALMSALEMPVGAAAVLEPPSSTSTNIDEIVVTGQRPEELRKLLRDFVVEVGDPVSGSRGYARWRKGICVGVHNLRNIEAAQFLADRISLVALEVGLEPGEPGCAPNINIIFSQDGRDMATRLVEAQPQAFRPFGGIEGTTQGLAALAEFKSSEAPVRWWQITMVVDELGLPAIDIWNIGIPPMVRGQVSRLKNSVSDDIWGSLVIVDANKVAGKSLPQLADYIAMVALAQIDPAGAPSNHDSILNLFGSANPPGLSEMDLAYLQALYGIDMLMMPHVQRGMLVNRMLRGRD